MKDYGIQLTVDIIKQLLVDGDIRGFHFCTLNLEKSVQKVIENLGWLGNPQYHPETNKLIMVRTS